MAVFNAQEAILKVYNRATNKSLTVDDVIFGIPIMIPTGYPRNARMKVYPKPHTLETTILPIAYNKIHVSELGTIKVLKGARTTVHEVLNDIRTNYEYDLKTTDVVNSSLGAADGDGYVAVELQFESECIGFYSGTYIDTPVKLKPATVEKAYIDRLAAISVINSSYFAVILNSGKECHSNKRSAVRSDFGMTNGKYYWEAKLIARGAILGICSKTSVMNYIGDSTIGTNSNSWGLDTATGLFKNANTSVQLTRPIETGEWVGMMFDKDTGDLTYVLSDVSYTVNTTANLLSEVYVNASGNDIIRSVFSFNLGGEPMIHTVPAGARHGIYTLDTDSVVAPILLQIDGGDSATVHTGSVVGGGDSSNT